MGSSTIRVVAAIIFEDGKILACKRKDGSMAGYWEFPGGKIEDGESGVDALRRELTEELGVRLSTIWLLDTIEYDYPEFHLSMDCFVCVLVPGSIPKLHVHDDMRWLSQDELLDVEWLPANVELVKMIGLYWSQIFEDCHL